MGGSSCVAIIVGRARGEDLTCRKRRWRRAHPGGSGRDVIICRFFRHFQEFRVFIPSAFAQASAPSIGGDSGLMGFLPIILMFVLLYFLMIRPQMKRAKEQKAMIDALQKGDEVVAAGGLVGKIVELNEHYATLEIAAGTEIKVQRGSVGLLLPKGTIKNIK
jgi:preprotein translocase subunit YajC